MAVIIRLGLLVVLAIVVKAAKDFEYSADVLDALLPKQTADPIPLKFEVANSKNVILLERRADSPGNIFYVKNQNEEDEKTGINAYLKKSPIERTFNLRQLQFSVQNAKISPEISKPYVELTVNFFEPTTTISLEVVMHLFKPPTEEENKQHSEEHGVPFLGYSIPESLFHEIVSSPPEHRDQAFLADFTWFQEIFNRALYKETKPREATSKYTEVYFAGPVIMDLETSSPSGVILAPLDFDDFVKASILKVLS